MTCVMGLRSRTFASMGSSTPSICCVSRKGISSGMGSTDTPVSKEYLRRPDMSEQAGTQVPARHQPSLEQDGLGLEGTSSEIGSPDMPASSSQICWQEAKVLQQLLKGAVQPAAKSTQTKELCQRPGCAGLLRLASWMD